MSQPLKSYDSPKQRLAMKIVQKLNAAGHIAYFAGGCVRDSLLGRAPKDYDVATTATPEQVRGIFGHRRTLAVGAAFGVIVVLGDAREDEGQIEVATFRMDGLYVDGRHPDTVLFSTPEKDAQRRDFTINGLFFDPHKNEVIDFVDGQADLRKGVVRAIGCAEDRFQEDKLRLLRGIRFAAEFGFQIEAETFQAIKRLASEIRVVSGERIATEMQRAFTGSHPAQALGLLYESGLLGAILPETAMAWPMQTPDRERTWGLVMPSMLDSLRPGGFAAALAGLLVPVRWGNQMLANPVSLPIAQKYISGIASRWRLSNTVRDAVAVALSDLIYVIEAHERPWSEIQPRLIHPYRDVTLALAHCCVKHLGGLSPEGVALCHERIGWEDMRLNPPPLLSGDDLLRLGIPPGPRYKELLSSLRAAQLDEAINDTAAAKAWVQQFLPKS